MSAENEKMEGASLYLRLSPECRSTLQEWADKHGLTLLELTNRIWAAGYEVAKAEDSGGIGTIFPVNKHAEKIVIFKSGGLDKK